MSNSFDQASCCTNSRPPHTGLEVLGDLAHKPLEGQLADEELSGLLVLADLTQGDGARTVPVGLLHATCRHLREGCQQDGAGGSHRPSGLPHHDNERSKLTGGRRGLASCLGGQLLAGRLATRGLASGLLCTSHGSSCLSGQDARVLREDFGVAG